MLHSLAAGFLLVETGRLSRASVTSEQFGLGLSGLFPIWLAVVGSLYPLTRWFAGLKARRRDLWWLRYL